DVWVPLMMAPVYNPLPADRLTRRTHQWLTVMARRKDGVPLPQARASLAVLYHQIREHDAAQLVGVNERYRERFMSRQIVVQPGGQGFQTLQREMRTTLWMLF